MKKSILLILAGVVVIGGAVAFIVFDKKSNNADDQTNQRSTSENTSSNFEKIKDEKLEGELVSSFPKDEVPLYPGDVKSSLGKMDFTGERAEWNVEVATADSFEKVDASIREAYEGDGWSIVTDKKTGLGGTMLIARSSGYTASIIYEDTGDGILINYGVSQH